MPRSNSRRATEAMCVSYQLYALLTLPHTFAALWFELLDAHDTHTCICTHAIDRPTVDDRVAERPHRLHGQRGEAPVCLHAYVQSRHIDIHTSCHVCVHTAALIQVNEHNRRHCPGATAAVHPTPMVSGVNFLTSTGTVPNCALRLLSTCAIIHVVLMSMPTERGNG